MPTVNPGIAAVLSFLVSGLGQIYNGQIKKGIWLIFLSALGMLILITGAIFIGHWFFARVQLALLPDIRELVLGIGLFFLGLFFICIVGIYSLFDAYKTAKEKGGG
ncbi:MAG: hypothetical protein NC898_04360 [Candidatus Omnitrophica bacterium]|nr:hypothetical protein [Candidatus Omnitrophota bacterium]MCM8793679.1 hypothetical protein [Candidatus Omnitrophota bacterium]